MGFSICDKCWKEIQTIKYEASNSKNDFQREHFNVARAFAYHEGIAREIVHRLKYENDLGLGKVLAPDLANVISKNEWDVDIVVPIPLGKKRRRERGYSQAEVIAYPLAESIGKDYSPKLIRRKRETKTQIGLSAKERFENLDGAFEVTNGNAKGKRILLVDDVYTSGATMKSAAKELKEAGAKRVYSLTITRAYDFN